MPILTTLGAACAKAWGFTSGLITDQYFNLVSLLLPGNGTNGAQNNTFLDSSSNTFTITRNGNTTQGTFSPFSQTGWSVYFDGSNDSLQIADATALDLGLGNFTIETWIYVSGGSGTFRQFFSKYTGGVGIEWYVNSSNKLEVYFNGGAGQITSTGTINTNTWYHVALVRSGTGAGQTKFYINGTEDGSSQANVNVDNAGALYIGESGGGSNDFLGYVSNLRVVKGTAVYTGNFTPSTTPLSAISGTSLLVCQSNRFVDNSSSPLTVTANGNPSVTPFSPFAPTQSYSAAAVGGSGYFDGTGDYLTFTTSSSFALTGDFTIECWAYFTSSTSSQPIFDQYLSAGFLLQVSPGSTIGGSLYINSTAGADGITLSGASCPINAWNFLRIVRSGSTVTVYCNGVSAGSRTRTGNVLVNSTAFGIANYSTTYFTGYLSGVRIVASALTGTEVPTAPLTAITNTQLLLNFTNAGVVDATAKNVLETVGDAQISNGAGGGKWGGGSIFFNPSAGSATDYLLSATPLSELAFLNNGSPWTVEGWFYTGSTSAQTILSTNAASATVGINIGINSTAAGDIVCGIYRGVSGSSLTAASSGSAWSTNTWVYFAVVLDASKNLKIYINGSQVATTSGSSFSFSSSNPTYPLVIGRYQFSTPGEYFNGYIDDLRITRGVARTITASPSAPFPVQ